MAGLIFLYRSHGLPSCDVRDKTPKLTCTFVSRQVLKIQAIYVCISSCISRMHMCTNVGITAKRRNVRFIKRTNIKTIFH